ncbi:MAG: hypothetical protein C0404_05515, partial [Verrucomicrobia bacterium]|nr:hypothetical protein [Verrucomicrobiota bacterium]
MNEGNNSESHNWAATRRLAAGGLLSIVMPAHNLGRTIATNIREVHNLLSGVVPFEIVVVDDGSTDNTRPEIERIVALIPTVRPVFMLHNMGKGAALKRGFSATRGSFVLLLDADLDIPPGQINRFFEIMERENTQVVIGSKMHPGSSVGVYPWHRKLASSIYYMLVKILMGLPVRDTQTGMKLFKREVLDWTFPRMLVKRFAFDLELLAIAHDKGYKIAESPVELAHQSTWGFHKPASVYDILIDTAAVFYRIRILHYYQTIRSTHMPVPEPLVSIVVAYPAASSVLDECVAGINEQLYTNYEVILLPDVKSARTWPQKFREIPTGKIRPAEKRNIGIREARGDIIAFIDDDAYPTDTWLQEAVVYFSDEHVAGVGGPAVTPPNDPYMAKLSGRIYASRFVSGQYRYRYEAGRVRSVDDYPSCNLFVRTSMLRQLGGFRTDFWPGEDTFLCMEITRGQGKEIVYDPRVMVFHHRRKLFLPHLRQIGRYAMHRGYFARKFPSTSRRISYMIPSLFVIGLLAGGGLSFVSDWCRYIYLAVVAIYAAIILAATFSFHPLAWAITFAGVFLTHVVYGTRFIFGLATG